MLFEKVYWLIIWLVYWNKKYHVESQGERSSRENTSTNTSSSRGWLNGKFTCNSFFLKHGDLYKNGLQLEKDEFYDEAIDCYSKAIKKRPENPQYYRQRAGCHLKLKHWKEAIHDYRDVLRILPDSKNDRLVLCKTLFDHGDYMDAAEEIIRTKDNEEIAELGQELMYKRLYNEAIKCFDAAIELESPLKSTYFRRRGECHMALKSCDNAILDYQMMVQADSENKDNKIILSEAYYSCNKFNEAIHVILDLNDNYQLEKFGDKFMSRRKFAEALLCFNPLIGRNPPNDHYYRLRGNCHWKMLNYEAALKDFSDAAKLYTGHSNEPNRAALKRLLFDMKEFSQAAEDSLKLLNDFELETLGLEFFRKSWYHHAVCCFTEAINQKPYEKKYYKRREKCYKEMENWDMVIADLRKMIELDPENKEHKISLGEAFMDSGKFRNTTKENLAILSDTELEILGMEFFERQRYQDALNCYTQALEKKQKSIYYRQRGHCYTFLGLYENAILEFKNAMRADPNDIESRNYFTSALLNLENFVTLPEDMVSILTEDEFEVMGNQFHQRSKYEEALRCYTMAIERNPGESTHYRNRGNCYKKLKKPILAIYEFRNAVQVDPTDRRSRKCLFDALFEYKQFDKILEEILDILTDYDLETLGMRFLDNLYFKQALRCFDEAIRKNPNEGTFYIHRANCYKDMKQPIMAISDFKKAVSLDPSDAERRLYLSHALLEYDNFNEIQDETLNVLTNKELGTLGDQFFDMSRLGNALRCYSTAIARKPEATYFRRRGNCYMKMKNENFAIAEYQRALQVDPTDQESAASLKEALYHYDRFNQIPNEILYYLTDMELLLMGNDFFTEGKFAFAIRCYDKAIEKNPYDANFRRQRALCYWKKGDVDIALAELRKLRLQNPDHEEVYSDLSEILFELQRYDELIQETMLLSDVELAELGDKFFSFEKYDEALRCYDEALRKNPKQSVCFAMRGFCHWRMGNLEKAIDDLKETLRVNPTNARYLISLSEVLVDAGRFQEARNALTNIQKKFMQAEDIAKLEEARDKIEKRIEKMRLNELMLYLEKLINEEKYEKIKRLTKESSTNIESIINLQSNIEEVESTRVSVKDIRLIIASSRLPYDDQTLDLVIISEYVQLLLILRISLEKVINQKLYVEQLKTSFANHLSPKLTSSKTFVLQRLEYIEIPKHIEDPVSYLPMDDPVTSPRGITYNREVIVDVIRRFGKEPTTTLTLREKDLRPNKAIKEAVQLWRLQNNFD